MNKWILLNKEELPKDDKGKIIKKECVGYTLKFKCTNTEEVCDIKILEYITGKGGVNNKFLIEYIYLSKYKDYEEKIIKEIGCSNILNGSVGGIIPSLNKWVLKDGYWEGITVKGIKFKFSTKDKNLEHKILHNTWSIKKSGYIEINKKEIRITLHRAIMFGFNNVNNNLIIDHINNDKLDNREDNLRIVNSSENSRNRATSNTRKDMLVGLRYIKETGSWFSRFDYMDGKKISTKFKKDRKEAEIDNLIAQRYLGYMHNNDQFYRIENLPKERIKEVTNLLDKKIKRLK